MNQPIRFRCFGPGPARCRELDPGGCKAKLHTGPSHRFGQRTDLGRQKLFGFHTGKLVLSLRHQGFDALHRQPRKDKGSRKALSPEACQALLEWRQKYPQLTIKLVVRQLIEKGTLQSGAFSLPSVYRFLAAHQLDARSIKHNPPSPLNGPPRPLNAPWPTNCG
jgi:hypothetical protein